MESNYSGESAEERLSKLEARMKQEEKSGPSWWKNLSSGDTSQARIVKVVMVLAVLVGIYSYGESMLPSLPELMGYLFYCLGVMVVVLVVDYLFTLISSMKFYDERGASIEMMAIHKRLLNGNEKPGDNEAIGRQHMGASIRRGLIFLAVIILHMHGKVG